MINIPHSNSIKEINLTRELVITWPNSNCVFKGLFYETKILTIQYSNEKEIHNRNSKIPICNRYNLDAFPIQIDEVKKINFIASESIVKKITFEEEVKEVLRTKNRIETAQLLWKCAVRNLPFLGMAGNFNYWKAGNVQSHLYSVFNALDLAYYVSYSNSLSTFLAEDFRWDAYESAYAIEHYSIFALNAAEKYNATETDVNYASAINIVSDAINTIVSATSFIISEFINNHPTLDLIYPTYLAEPAHIITRIPKFSSSKLSIKQNILADAKNKIKIKIDIEDYGEIWDKFQNAMINVDCGYWANLYKGIFENNFEIDADELEKRLKLPDQIKKEGAAAVGQYLQQLLKGREHFNEARVIILGEKGAGKTCLARKLINPAASLTKEEESTPGVETTLWRLEKDNINIRIWDFAGHTVTHAVHRFFLSEQCVYIMVYDGRTESRNRLEYWLNHMQIYGGNSRAFIFVNEKDQHHTKIAINNLKEKYNIVDLYAFNIAEEINELEKFRNAIKQYIKDNPSWKKQEIPKSYYYVKEALEALFNKKEDSKSAEFINKEKFDKIAKQYKVDDTDILLTNLHQLGISLWFKNMEAYNTLVLNPEWISQGVYQIINWVNNKETYQLTLNCFTKVFASNLNRFPANKHSFLFELMKEYELAYESNSKTLIIPHLLNEDQPDKLPTFKMEDSLLLKYVTDVTLPSNSISRFIVRHHKQIKYKNNIAQVWRYGVVLKDDKGSLALVREQDRTISVEVKGINKTEYLAELRETLNDIFESYKNKKPSLTYRIKNYGEIPSLVIQQKEPLYLSEQQILSYIISHRIYFDANTLSEISLDKTAEEYAIEIPFKGKSPTIKIFLSYSHKDETYKQELDTHFAALKRNQKIETWSDYEILAGQSWNNEIKRELAESNIILILVSADFIASNYIWEIEVKKALQRHNRGEARVVPIYCRPCDFEGMPFAQLQGLPKKEVPIADFENKDKAYLEIVKGIRKVIDDFTI